MLHSVVAITLHYCIELIVDCNFMIIFPFVISHLTPHMALSQHPSLSSTMNLSNWTLDFTQDSEEKLSCTCKVHTTITISQSINSLIITSYFWLQSYTVPCIKNYTRIGKLLMTLRQDPVATNLQIGAIGTIDFE